MDAQPGERLDHQHVRRRLAIAAADAAAIGALVGKQRIEEKEGALEFRQGADGALNDVDLRSVQ